MVRYQKHSTTTSSPTSPKTLLPTQKQLLMLTSKNKELSAKLASLQKEVTYLQEINALLKARQ